MKKPKILVVGSLVMDLVAETARFPQAGETVLGDAFHTACGGKGANQAYQAARLGADVTMVGKVGADAFGDQLVDSLKACGVDCRHILRTDEASSAVGHIQIEKSEKGVQNRILVVSGANMKIVPEDVAFLKEEIRQYDLMILQMEIPSEINALAIDMAYQAGVPVMLNPAPFRPIDPKVLEKVTYVSPNETEAALMLGHAVNGREEAMEALKEMQRMGVRKPMITLGSVGAVCVEGEPIFEPALKGLPVKDPTAAGDSFISAFTVAMGAGADGHTAMSFAKHAAGITVCGMGAQPSLPDAGQVFALMEEKGNMTEEARELQKALCG